MISHRLLRDDADIDVVAFTATQIPGIADRWYLAELAGPLYPGGIPIIPEGDLERVIREEKVDTVVFAYSDVSHATVMHAASRVLAAGADFALLDRTMLSSTKPVSPSAPRERGRARARRRVSSRTCTPSKGCVLS